MIFDVLLFLLWLGTLGWLWLIRKEIQLLKAQMAPPKLALPAPSKVKPSFRELMENRHVRP